MRIIWKNIFHLFYFTLWVGIVSSCNNNPRKATIDFNIHVRPILSDKCFACHGPDGNARKAELRLDTEEGLFNLLRDSSGYVVVPGSPEKSKLYERIASHDPELMMPPPEFNVPVDNDEIEIIEQWIEEGAPWKKHWAFIKPHKHTPPEINDSQINNPIDNFVFAKLEERGLEPKDQAEKEILLRRLSFDITGLPPSVGELNELLDDNSDDVFDKYIEKLLASKAYGEKMAVEWMDVSRFADTHGYTVDRYRPMWRWRNWVIDAYNKNMPFDEFVKWQIAGDLIPGAGKEQILATGFNRNHAQNMEGGIINEEFRSEYVADRTITLGRAFLGITMECARCHDHKYDPITQKNFYQVYGFFNNVDEAGQISWNDATPVPSLMLPTPAQENKIDSLKREINLVESKISDLPKKEIDFSGISINDFNKYLSARFSFDGHLRKSGDSKISAVLNEPVYVSGKKGRGIQLNGDDPLTFGEIGLYSKSEPFTVSLWANIPENLEKGVIFHKGDGAILHNFRGYHLKIVDNKFEIMMAHTWPYNSIHERSETKIPRNTWVHLALTHDGSGSAEGFKLFLNGEEIQTSVLRDNLYKDILFKGKNTITSPEPGLKIGARVRGKGFKDGLIDELNVYDVDLPDYAMATLAGKPLKRTKDNSVDYYSKVQSPRWNNLQQELKKLRIALSEEEESVEEVMVMREMDEKRETYILKRGEYNNFGVQVEPGTPESIMAFPEKFNKDRLGLAQWLTSEENPLVARVTVNRLWQQFFGRGLVSTPEDFGNQGDLPSHPLLLDYLANEFIASGWDVQHMVKLIVSSATYRQSSVATEKEISRDPNNKWLSRGPSRRMSAEMIRDHLLAASDLLVDSIGGSSVKPYQPDGLWRVNNATYTMDEGDDLYRRSLYTFWKRTVPPPSMKIFDAPSRSYCVVNRQKTSTPLQALNLMNDPQIIEAGTALAEEALRKENDEAQRLEYIFRSLTSRFPNKQEREIMDKMLSDYTLKASDSSLDGFLNAGKKNFELSNELKAYSLVANTLINLDATIMIR